jgi:iron complex transport system substrate-binding protein
MNKTKIDRRALLGGLTAAFVAPRYSFAAGITDATGRTVTAPDRLMRIYPAGPPAAVELYTLAPDLLMGWLEPIGQEEREFLLPESAALPKIPRLTGRDSDDINLGALASLKPDLILDVGNVDAAYSSLAERVQQQSGIPYVLLDGHLDRIGATYRALGRLIGRSEQAETRRATPKPRSRRSRSAAPKCRTTRAPVSITPATRAGWKPASAAR